MVCSTFELESLYRNLLLQNPLSAFQLYADTIGHRTGNGYAFGRLPFYLPGGMYVEVEASVRAITSLLASALYRDRILTGPTFLPYPALRSEDLIGSVDFHLGENGLKIIDVNFNVPGLIGFAELLESAYYSMLSVPGRTHLCAGLMLALADIVGGDRGGRVAIAVSHLPMSQPFLRHYRILAEEMRSLGVDANLVFARDVVIGSAGELIWDNQGYDAVLSLVIPAIWEQYPSEFSAYSAAYAVSPHRFYPNPVGGQLGSKLLLTMLGDLETLVPDLLAKERTYLERATLAAKPLNSFSNPEEAIAAFGGLCRMVLKPTHSYGSQGVIVQPSQTDLNKVFDRLPDGYIVQDYYAPLRYPALQADGSLLLEQTRFELRAFFVGGRFAGATAYEFGKGTHQCPMVPVVLC
jgi:hypothetical protein